MKKIICLFLALIFIFALSACSPKNNGGDPTKPGEPAKPELGEQVELEEVVIFDENNKPFTAENLPDDCKHKDFDADGLNNETEIENGTDMYRVDTDGDGISDFDEIKNTKTDPTKWSTRDDGKSDLEYMLVSGTEFKEEYTATDANGFKVYLAKAEDRLWVISKTSTNVFDDLETISEAFQIKYFSGKVALNCNKYVDEVANSIAIYKDVNGKATKVECTVTEDRLVEFNLEENDVFVVVYESK